MNSPGNTARGASLAEYLGNDGGCGRVPRRQRHLSNRVHRRGLYYFHLEQ